MPVFRNTVTGIDEFVPDELVAAAAASGEYDIPEGTGKAVVTPAGHVRSQPLALEHGLPDATPEQIDAEAHEQYAEREYGGVGDAIGVGLEAAIDTASFGGYGALGDALVPGFAERRRDAISVNEGPNLAGTVIGAVAPAIASGGTGAGAAIARATPAGAASRIAGAIAPAGSGLARKVVGGVAEGAAFGVGAGVQELALEEDPLTFERAAGALSSNVLVGAAGGGVLSGAVHGVGAGVRGAKKLADGAADRFAKQARVADDLVDLDKPALRTARETEEEAIEQVRVGERATLAQEIAAARQQAKTDKPWIALEGFKAKRGGKKSSAVPKAPKPPKKPRRAVKSEVVTTEDGMEFQLQSTDAPGVAGDLDRAFDKAYKLDKDPATTWVRLVQMRNGAPVMIDDVPKVVGHAQLAHRADGTLYPRNVEILEPFRRRGLASKLYEAAEKRTGRRVIASETQTDTGKAFSSAYRGARDAGTPAPGPIKLEPAFAREVREIGIQSLKADKQLDNLLNNPKRLAERPYLAEAALQQQEHALQRLQKIAPDLKAAMAADTASSGQREIALETVDAAIEQNRTFQARIKALQEKPRSPRLQAIQDAEDALSAAPKGGLLRDASVGFGAAALTGMVPGGPVAAAAAIVAPRVLKKIADLVQKRMVRASAKAAADTESAVTRFLTGAARVKPAALPLATTTLAGPMGPRSDRDPKPAKKGSHREELGRLYRAREGEILDQVAPAPDGSLVVRPDARQRIAEGLSGVAAVSPILADQLETHAVKVLEFLANRLPKRPDFGAVQVGTLDWQPASSEMRTWARFKAAVDDIGAVEGRLADGTLTPQDAEVFRELFPERLADLTRQIVERLPEIRGRLPRARQLSLSILTGVAVHPALEPKVLAILQQQHSQEEGTEGGNQAPPAAPQFGSVKAEPFTSAQERTA